MTFSLLQGNRYIGPLATIAGYGDLMNYVYRSRAGKYPNLAALLDKGFTNNPDLVAREAIDAAPFSPSRDISDTLTNLAKLLKGKTGKIIVGDA